MVEKVAFVFGKTVINAMSKNYGAVTVGALGISNNINGTCTNTQNGFQDGGAAIISQNIGAGKYDRALDAFKKTLIINIGIGIILFILTIQYLDFISSLFAAGDATFEGKRELNIAAIAMFMVFIVGTLGITYWAAKRTKSATFPVILSKTSTVIPSCAGILYFKSPIWI